MNKIRWIGLFLVLVGVTLNLLLENEMIDFLTGFLVGAGGSLLIIGKLNNFRGKKSTRSI